MSKVRFKSAPTTIATGPVELADQAKTMTLHTRLSACIGQQPLLQESYPITAISHIPKPRIRPRLDPLHILDPARKKLTTMEAQRIIGVLDETKTKCDLIIALPEILQNLHQYEGSFSAELMHLLVEQQKFHEQLNKFDLSQSAHGTKTPELSGITESSSTSIESESQYFLKTKFVSHVTRRDSVERGVQREPIAESNYSVDSHDVMSDINAVKCQLEWSIKNVVRAFFRDPVACLQILPDIANKQSKEGTYFVQNFDDLKNILLEKLLMTPAEDRDKLQYIAQVTAQEKNNVLVLERLEQEVKQAIEDKDKEIRNRNELIRKLQNDLHALEKSTEDEIRRIKTETEKQVSADNKNSDGKKQKLQVELNLIKAQLQNLTTEHREEEQLLRKKKYKMETEVENWLSKYDNEMADKQSEYEEIEAVYMEEKKQLAELELRFKNLEVEYLTITESQARDREKREADERLKEIRDSAATLIQAVWRSFTVRRNLKHKAKRGKRRKKRGKMKGTKLY